MGVGRYEHPVARTTLTGAGSSLVLVAAAKLDHSTQCDVLASTDAWIRGVIAADHPILGKPVCPFVTPALHRNMLFYSAITGCRSSQDVINIMDELIERFIALPPLSAHDAQLKTLVAVFVDVEPTDAETVVIAAHRELKAVASRGG